MPRRRNRQGLPNRIEIEVYKKQVIEYDTETDKFVCDIIIEDKTKTTNRKSLKDVRKEIDAFIKLNMDFKPFKALEISQWGREDEFNEVEITGIRTDGIFIVKMKGNSRVEHYGEKAIARLRVFDYDAVQEKKKLEDEATAFRQEQDKKKKALVKKLKPLDLSMYKISS